MYSTKSVFWGASGSFAVADTGFHSGGCEIFERKYFTEGNFLDRAGAKKIVRLVINCVKIFFQTLGLILML